MKGYNSRHLFAICWIAIFVFLLTVLNACSGMGGRSETKMASVESAKPNTIAVLPFVNLSPDPAEEYFVDGFSEELLNVLAKISELRVASRADSFSFKGSNKTLQEIASILGVEYLLEGSVRKSENFLRVTAQLIRPVDGLHLWSKTYDRELKDIFAIQEDIVTAIADKLNVTPEIEKSI